MNTASMKQNDTLNSIFALLSDYSAESDELVESLQSQVAFPLDFELNLLTSNHIYIRKKSFIDSCNNFEKIEKEMLITDPTIYEEFEVIKINNFGIKQERILGVDGEKLYNYEPKAHQMFSEKKKYYGTKIPERLISTIIEVIVTKKGVNIVLKEKTLKLLIENHKTRLKLFSKINSILELKK